MDSQKRFIIGVLIFIVILLIGALASTVNMDSKNTLHGELTLNADAINIISGTIKNTTSQLQKDPLVECSFYGESGTLIAKKSDFAFIVIRPNETKTFNNIIFNDLPVEQITKRECKVFLWAKS